MLSFSDARFEKAIKAVEYSVSIADLQAAIKALLEPYGLQHAVYHVLSIPTIAVVHEVPIMTYPNDWVAHYLKKRYYEVDPVVQTGQRSLLPIDWDNLDKSSDVARKLFHEADDAGIGPRGLSLSIRGAAGDHALFTITSNLSQHDWEQLKALYIRDMQAIGFYIHSRVLHIKGASFMSPSKLSGRELECLKWAAAGKTIEDTAAILGLAFSTVRVYLDSARHKLGCLSKAQAVARAEQLGLINR